MNKVVFFDIDGTLLDHDKNLPATTKTAISLLQDNGAYVAIATGRGPFMFEKLREELGIHSFVSFNGQFVVFENEMIYKKPLDRQELDQLYQEANKQDHPMVFLNDQTMKASIEHHKYIEEGISSLMMAHPEKDENFYKNREIYQALLFCEQEDEKSYVEKYGKFDFIRWHRYSTDVIPVGGSKAQGIKKMIDLLGFRMEDVYAFGDGLNDIEMIKSVGTGVAMGNALSVVKTVADYITTDVDQDGIWHGLKKLDLI